MKEIMTFDLKQHLPIPDDYSVQKDVEALKQTIKLPLELKIARHFEVQAWIRNMHRQFDKKNKIQFSAYDSLNRQLIEFLLLNGFNFLKGMLPSTHGLEAEGEYILNTLAERFSKKLQSLYDGNETDYNQARLAAVVFVESFQLLINNLLTVELLNRLLSTLNLEQSDVELCAVMLGWLPPVSRQMVLVHLWNAPDKTLLKQFLTAGVLFSSSDWGKVDFENKILFEAIQEKYSIDIIQAILAAGVKLNVKNSIGDTPLHTALKQHPPALAVAKLLLACKDIDYDKPDGKGATPLILALRLQQPPLDMIEGLLKRDANVHADAGGEMPALMIAEKKLLSLIPLLINNKTFKANTKNATGKLPNATGENILHVAAAQNLQSLTEYLLENEEMDVNAVDRLGDTALHNAILAGADGIVALLLDKNANPNLPNKNKITPIDLAIMGARGHILSQLIAAKAAVNEPGTYDVLPLHKAIARHGAHASVVKLLQAGANAFIRGESTHLDKDNLQYTGLEGPITAVELLADHTWHDRDTWSELTTGFSILELITAQTLGKPDCLQELINNLAIDINEKTPIWLKLAEGYLDKITALSNQTVVCQGFKLGLQALMSSFAQGLPACTRETKEAFAAVALYMGNIIDLVLFNKKALPAQRQALLQEYVQQLEIRLWSLVNSVSHSETLRNQLAPLFCVENLTSQLRGKHLDKAMEVMPVPYWQQKQEAAKPKHKITYEQTLTRAPRLVT